MPRYWTHYWKNRTWHAEARHPRAEGDTLDHLAGNEFEKRGVEPGDIVYVVTVLKGHLHVLGRMEVDALVTQEQAEKVLQTDDLWEAGLHCIAKPGASLRRFDGPCVTQSDAESLLFEGRLGPQSLVIHDDGRLDQQTLRSLRELTPQSAMILDRYVVWPAGQITAERGKKPSRG